MKKRKIDKFDKRMKNFTEINFYNNNFIGGVEIVAKVDGADNVKYFKRTVSNSALLPFYDFGGKDKFLNAFKALNIAVWKRRNIAKQLLSSEKTWSLTIKFSNGKEVEYFGNTYPEGFLGLYKLMNVSASC